MRIVCKENDKNKLSEERHEMLKRCILISDGEIGLEIGREYIVYGITCWSGVLMYYVCGYNIFEYPVPKPADFFNIVDNTIPENWKLYVKEGREGDITPYFVFEEWANDPMFYERLIDGYPEEVKIFERYSRYEREIYEKSI